MEMHFPRTALLAGAAALAIGTSGAALAEAPQTHVMALALPGGGVARIEYAGPVPPRVVIGEAPPAFAALPAASLFGPDSAFAAMERVSAEMDRAAAAMFTRAESLAAQARSGQPVEAAYGNLPAGMQGYSYISTLSDNGVCSRSVEITANGTGAPRIVSHSSGNCGGAAAPGGAVGAPAAPAPSAKRPDLLLTRSDRPSYAGIVRQVAAQPR
jgi:hypothetical protein